MSVTDLSRRQVLKGSAAAMAMGTIGSLGALYSRQARAATSAAWTMPVPSPYGALAPVADQSTGLPLLQLPVLRVTDVCGYAVGLGDSAISLRTVLDGCAPLLIHASAFARSMLTCGGSVTGL